MFLYAITIFLSAFLLFQIQPLIAKTILPWFGGASSVWSTCMLFFQCVLLGGYVYAHWLHSRFSARKQAIIHCSLLAVSLAVLPVAPDPSWKGSALAHPILRILGLLLTSVGLPYFLLSTTGPLLQAWYARTHKGSIPYRLYALSNAGSMLALLTYPILVEPSLVLRSQGLFWSGAFAIYVCFCGFAAWRFSNLPGSTVLADAVIEPAPSWRRRIGWMSLAACASILLLSTTTFLTQDVASIPFLWILPLVVYLLTFILCFETPRFYRRMPFLILLIPALAGMAHLFNIHGEGFTVPWIIAASAGSLFVFCMVCHGELVRSRPHSQHLTLFYVMLSAGGAVGGIFVGVVAPGVFRAFYEFPLGLALCGALAVAALWRAADRYARVILATALCAYGVWLGFIMRDLTKGCRVVTRNFYGQLRIRDTDLDDDYGPRRVLLHGRIEHGEQFLTQPLMRQPVTYFCPGTGIAQALSVKKEARRIGILGLGCGTLAAYGRAGDEIRIYEINPEMVKLAQAEFSYLKDTPAKTEVVPGDGRLMLEREQDQRFDVLVMDAFSGDSVPVHLVTLEAFQTYTRHLAPGGILAVNVSNKYIDLRPVMERAANRLGKVAMYFSFEPEEDDAACFTAAWVLVMDDSVRRANAGPFHAGQVLQPAPGFRPWTDGYSNLLRILISKSGG